MELACLRLNSAGISGGARTKLAFRLGAVLTSDFGMHLIIDINLIFYWIQFLMYRGGFAADEPEVLDELLAASLVGKCCPFGHRRRAISFSIKEVLGRYPLIRS